MNKSPYMKILEIRLTWLAFALGHSVLTQWGMLIRLTEDFFWTAGPRCCAVTARDSAVVLLSHDFSTSQRNIVDKFVLRSALLQHLFFLKIILTNWSLDIQVNQLLRSHRLMSFMPAIVCQLFLPAFWKVKWQEGEYRIISVVILSVTWNWWPAKLIWLCGMMQTLSASDLRSPDISSCIATKMREFHGLDMPGPTNVVLWDRLRYWFCFFLVIIPTFRGYKQM